MVAFGEKVYFQHTHVGKEDDRKDIGVFVGMMNRSATYLIANASGVYGSPNIAPFPDDQAFDPDLALSVNVRHHEYLDGGVRAPPGLRVVPAVAPDLIPSNPEADPVVTANGGYVPRRVRIVKADLIAHGYTSGCPACLSAKLGDGVRRGPHTEDCRVRIEGLMTGDRLENAKVRMEAWATQQAEPDFELSECPVKTGDKDVSMEPPAVVAEDDEDESDLVDAPGPSNGGRVRFGTPDRAPATRRKQDVEGGPEIVKRRLDDQMEDVDAPASSGSPLQQWYNGAEVGGQDRDTGMEVGSPDSAQGSADGNVDMDSLFATLSDEERRIVSSVILGADLTELYSPERVNKLAGKFGLTPGHSLDLTNGWDFTKPEDRRRAWKLLKSSTPYVVVGSPPCTLFSMLQELNLYIHRNDPEWLAGFECRWQEAVQHIEFCAHVYRWQLNNGRHFIHEHPRDAKSWELEFIQDLLKDPRVTWLEGHMCQFGMTAPVKGSQGDHGQVKKPTGFLTSSRFVAEELNRYCDGSHDHVHLVAGKAAAAQVYPPELCKAMLRGTAKQKQVDQSSRVATSVGHVHAEDKELY